MINQLHNQTLQSNTDQQKRTNLDHKLELSSNFCLDLFQLRFEASECFLSLIQYCD